MKGQKFKVVENGWVDDDFVWISAHIGDIIEAEDAQTFFCLCTDRKSLLPQTITNAGSRKLQLKRIRGTAKTTAEKLGIFF